jgi:two-component system, chemotaxis family, protein-glutamate methylesterase/glutaminase
VSEDTVSERAAGPEAVVIGASAGGVEALGMLLPALPADLAPAVIAVLHLPADSPALLVELFAGRCRVPVREAADKEPVEPGVIYFAPPNYHLLVELERTFALSVEEPVNYVRPAIDLLFESAARAYGDQLLGVMLTGANSDGARGLARIRSAGGRAWIQQPEDAAAAAMPLAALRIAGADEVLTLAQIRSRFSGFGHRR